MAQTARQAKTIDITQILDRQRLGGFHIVLLVFSFLVTMVDGYDIGAAAFAGPALVKEWSLKGPELGILFSATLFSGFFGPPLLGYLSDRFGRKRTIVGGCIFFGLLTWASILSASVTQLTVLRFIAGIGIAGVLPITVALNNEFAPRRLRATMVTIIFLGTTFGGSLPGFVAAAFLGNYGWHILFWIGGLVPVGLAIVLVFVLPESLKYLSLRPARRDELATLLRRLEPGLVIQPDAQFVISGEENRTRFSFTKIFAGRLAWLTPLFFVTNAANLMVFYFINQWLPTVLSARGIPVSHAVLAATWFQLAGTLGGLVIMRPLDKWGFFPVPILFACAIPIVAAIGQPVAELPLMLLIAAAGFCLLGLQFGNIAIETNIYPTYIRSWGVGACFAAGRVGSAVGPVAGGFLMARHLPNADLYFIATIPIAVGLVAAVAIVPLYRRHMAGQDAGLAPAGPAVALGQ